MRLTRRGELVVAGVFTVLAMLTVWLWPSADAPEDRVTVVCLYPVDYPVDGPTISVDCDEMRMEMER